MKPDLNFRRHLLVMWGRMAQRWMR